MNISAVTNKDIEVRLQLLNCCVAKEGVKLVNNLRQGKKCEHQLKKIQTCVAILDIFKDYTITEGNSTTFVDNTCVEIEDFDNILQWVNKQTSNCACFVSWGTFETPEGIGAMVIGCDFIVT